MNARIENTNGCINISNDVISSIAGDAAMRCYGVVGMAVRNKVDGIASLLNRDTLTKGIKVAADESGLSITVHIIVEYGVNIKTASDSIIENVKYQVESMTGFIVKNVTVNVESVRVS